MGSTAASPRCANSPCATQAQGAAGNRRQIEAVLTNRRASGYILTALNDGGSEFHAGILDLWRRPKTTYHDLPRLNRDRVLVLYGERAVVTRGDEAVVRLTVVDHVFAPAGGRILVQVCDPDGRTIAEEERTIPRDRASRSSARSACAPMARPGSTGSWRGSPGTRKGC